MTWLRKCKQTTSPLQLFPVNNEYDLTPSTAWLRGQPVQITWTPSQFANQLGEYPSSNLEIAVVKREWLQLPGTDTNISETAANSGRFQWKRVIWGFSNGNDYQLRFRCKLPNGEIVPHTETIYSGMFSIRTADQEDDDEDDSDCDDNLDMKLDLVT